MSTIKRFEDLECWQEARSFAGLIYEITETDPFKKDSELVVQVKSSAISSMAKIAEGFHRSSKKDFIRFLDYSRAFIAETLSHSYVAFDRQYIGNFEMSKIKHKAVKTWKELDNLISYLKKNPCCREIGC